jgi:predicted nucleic acid-binding Zn ribbon protein
MPTYEFRCPDGTIIERVFRMSDAPQAIPAPDGSGMAVRVISGGADLIFKGSGFYITDYGKDGKRDRRESTNTAEAKGDGAKGDTAKDAVPVSTDVKGAAKSAASSDAKGDSSNSAGASGSDRPKSDKKPGPASPSSGAAE